MYILGAILALGLLIIVHEAGHFFVGRWCGMRIERFSIGFGPGLLRWRSKKGTLFQLAPVPFGGFVEIKGMNIAEDVDPDDKQAYPNRPVWQRIATIFAGPGTNYLAAVVLAFGLYTCAGIPQDVTYYGVEATQEGYDAHAKLQKGDRLLAIDGQAIYAVGPDGKQSELSKITNAIGDREAIVTVLRQGQRLEIPIRAKFDDSKDVKRWRLGITRYQGQFDRSDVGVVTAAKEAVAYPFRQTAYIVGGLYGGLKRAIQGKDSGLAASGPVGIGQEFTKAFEAGFVVFLELLMALNVYLGLFNLLPLPALDGGRLAFLGYELVTRRRANPRIETMVHMVGILFLMVVMVLVTWKDIAGLF
jgi:regulator of sigma E protease